MENNSASLEILYLLLYAHENEVCSSPDMSISALKAPLKLTEDDEKEGDEYY